MMTDWYERTIKALQLNGKGGRTQECYARAMRMLSEFYEKTPDLISEEELQEYFLHRKNVNKWAPNTMRICYCGIRFFFEHVLKPCGVKVTYPLNGLPEVSTRFPCGNKNHWVVKF